MMCRIEWNKDCICITHTTNFMTRNIKYLSNIRLISFLRLHRDIWSQKTCPPPYIPGWGLAQHCRLWRSYRFFCFKKLFFGLKNIFCFFPIYLLIALICLCVQLHRGINHGRQGTSPSRICSGGMLMQTVHKILRFQNVKHQTACITVRRNGTDKEFHSEFTKICHFKWKIHFSFQIPPLVIGVISSYTLPSPPTKPSESALRSPRNCNEIYATAAEVYKSCHTI